MHCCGPDDLRLPYQLLEKNLAQVGGVAVNELQIFTPTLVDKNSENFSGVDGKGAVYGYGHVQVYKDIGLHLNGKKEYPITEEDCMNTLRLLDAFYRSNEVKDWVSTNAAQCSVNLGRVNEEISNLYRTPKP